MVQTYQDRFILSFSRTIHNDPYIGLRSHVTQINPRYIQTKISLLSPTGPVVIYLNPVRQYPAAHDYLTFRIHSRGNPVRYSYTALEGALRQIIEPSKRFTAITIKEFYNDRTENLDGYDVAHNGSLHRTGDTSSNTSRPLSHSEAFSNWVSETSHSSGSIPPGALQMPGYRAPRIQKSHFRSSVKTGSRSLRSGNYTGSGSHKKLRNGITMTELENTASSRQPTMVYVRGDPTKLLAPLESWKRLPGQLHPLTRQPLGHSDLRKVKTIGKIIKKKK